jgi:hypothetical protein
MKGKCLGGVSKDQTTSSDSKATRLSDVAELDFVQQNGLRVAELGIAGCHARVVHYPAGSKIPLHRHTRPSVKLLIRGALAIANLDGPAGQATDGTFYWCDGSIYRGDVLRDSYLLVIDEEGSERIEVQDEDLASGLLGRAAGRPREG